jgi:acyl-CoA synthetase (AMP-forming)/AMP-acid ligase II
MYLLCSYILTPVTRTAEMRQQSKSPLWCCSDDVAMQAMAKLHTVGYREDDVYLHCAPLFHIGGLSSMIAMLAVGATQVTHLPSRRNVWKLMSSAGRHRPALECLMNWLL